MINMLSSFPVLFLFLSSSVFLILEIKSRPTLFPINEVLSKQTKGNNNNASQQDQFLIIVKVQETFKQIIVYTIFFNDTHSVYLIL